MFISRCDTFVECFIKEQELVFIFHLQFYLLNQYLQAVEAFFSRKDIQVEAM